MDKPTPPIPDWLLKPGDPGVRSLEIRDKVTGAKRVVYFPKREAPIHGN